MGRFWALMRGSNVWKFCGGGGGQLVSVCVFSNDESAIACEHVRALDHQLFGLKNHLMKVALKRA